MTWVVPSGRVIVPSRVASTPMLNSCEKSGVDPVEEPEVGVVVPMAGVPVTRVVEPEPVLNELPAPLGPTTGVPLVRNGIQVLVQVGSVQALWFEFGVSLMKAYRVMPRESTR